MGTRDIFDDLIELLERQQLSGVDSVALPPESMQGLFATPSAKQPAKSFSARSAVMQPLSSTPARSTTPGPQAPVNPPLAPAPESIPSESAVIHSSTSKPGEAVGDADWGPLREMVGTCIRCPLHRTRHQPVFGEGSPSAALMFVGEGPGFHEDQSGRPFVGPAGKLLDKMIVAMQFSRASVYIANIVKCRPPGNRNPNDSEARTCLPYLQRQIELINPRVLVLLGAVPLLHLLGKTGITKLHGQWFEFKGIPTLPTFHPSFLLRSPARKKEAWEDLQLVMEKLGKDPAATLRRMRSGT